MLFHIIRKKDSLNTISVGQFPAISFATGDVQPVENMGLLEAIVDGETVLAYCEECQEEFVAAADLIAHNGQTHQ